jgi:serine phosphatase RsbU (regulator of sigma subunit)
MANSDCQVLLVEDGACDARVLELLLASAVQGGFAVERVGCLADALLRLRSPGVDIVLLNLNLPDSAGLETLDAVHEQAPRVPIVVLTATDDEEVAILALGQGAQDYLINGYVNIDLLVRSVRYAIERNRSRQRELRMREAVAGAREVQRRLLPSTAPRLAGFDIAGCCHSAHQCGGDFYDYFYLHDGSLITVVADVAGHGFGPAIVAATVRAYLRAAATLTQEVHEMLALANRLLINDMGDTHLVTVACLKIDPRTMSFTYSAAGQRSYLLHATNERSCLNATSLPFGCSVDEVMFFSPRQRLKQNDLLLLLTDGIWEASSHGEQFGMERILNLTQRQRHKPASEIIEALYSGVREFVGPSVLKDDVTAVVLKIE